MNAPAPMTSLHELTIKTFHEGLLAKKFSALEITQAFFRRIREQDRTIGAYLALHEEQAAMDAERVDVALAKDEPLGMLAGAPLAIKDLLLMKGERTTAGSKILEHYTASYDAGVIARLKAEQAIFLGKTNLDEFAMGSSTENSAFQITRNPHDPERVPGGSSGGSAAAVAAHLALGALGTDTGGSIREPAAFCGVVGLKPTYGAVSRSGLIALASSLDQIGPFAATVEDAAILFRAIAGKDPLDATSADPPDGGYGDELVHPDFERVRKLVVGVPEEYFGAGVEEDVLRSVEQARKTIESLKISFKKVSLPHTKYAVAAYYIILPAEVSANLARFDGIRYSRIPDLGPHIKNLRDIYVRSRGKGFGAEAKRRIILGTFVLSSGYYDAYYAKAQQVRALIRNDFVEAFKEVDVIFAPVTPTPAFKIGEKTADPLAMYLSDIFTIPANLAGVPAVAIPAPTPEGALPVGFQLIGKPFREADILGIGQYYERIVRGS